MKKIFIFLFCLTISLTTSAQASGGQIKRSPQHVSKQSRPKGIQYTKKYNPVEMQPDIYYLCINETWNVKNGQDLCRKMASKGYDVELVKNPDPSFGYHVCVKKEKDFTSARQFVKNFNDGRYHIAYVYYNFDLIKLVSDSPISLDDLYKYNVSVGSFSNLNDAWKVCLDFRNKNWGAEIFYDLNDMLYKVLILLTNDEQHAVTTANEHPYLKKNYPNIEVLYYNNGKVKRIK